MATAPQTINVLTQQTGIFNSLVPPEGPKAISQSLDFTTASSFLIDFTQAYAQGVISVVQTIWCDNSENSESITFSVAGTNQNITFPPFSQGSLPCISAVRTKLTATSATTTATVDCQFLNVPLPIGVWDARAVVATGSAGNATEITTGGTAAVAFVGGTVQNGAVITNPIEATESLFVDPVNPAGVAAPGAHGTTFELAAGQSFRVPAQYANDVSVNAASSGHTFTSWQY